MRPNVLVIQADDHAQWALGCYGNRELRTPSLDYLAATGVRMRDAFTPTPVCSPARASFWTGRLPSQHGLHDYLAEADPEVRAVPWLAGERTLAQILRDAGYTTGLAGKWHLGPAETRPDGFDYWYCHGFPAPRPQGFDSPWPRPPAGPPGGHNRHAITDHAVDFLRRRDLDRPFFLYVGPHATHSPWSGHAERLVRQYRSCTFDDIPDDATYPFGRLKGEAVYPTRADAREALAQEYASVSEIDEQVGRLLDELEAQRIERDTLVVYTSDHGLNTGHHGVWGKGNGTDPYNMLEESIRIPMLLRHPGELLGGQVRDEMVTLCDLFATILDHVGLPIEEQERERRRYPGRSFRAHCRGDARGGWPDEVYGEYGTLRMVRTRRHKLVRRFPDGPSELFDLERDPREARSVLDDPEYRAVGAALAAKIDAYFARHEDPERSGLRVRELPRHNGDEAWRWSGEHTIVDVPLWLARLQGAGDDGAP
jgi:choline-sulfatase